MFLDDVLEMIFLNLDLRDVLKCRVVCTVWKTVCSLHSFVSHNKKLIPKEERWPGEVRRWKTTQKKSFMTFIRIFGACLSELHLDSFVTDSLDWNLTRKQLHRLVKYCPNIKDFRSRETCKLYSTKDIHILSELNLDSLGFEETLFQWSNAVTKYLQTIKTLCIYGNLNSCRPEVAYILAECPLLEKLCISDLKGDECVARNNHPNLNELHISCSDLCDTQLKQISLLQNMCVLYFAYSLEDLGPKHLLTLVQSLHNLRKVSYQGVNERYNDQYNWDCFHEIWLETEQIMITRGGVLNDGWSCC